MLVAAPVGAAGGPFVLLAFAIVLLAVVAAATDWFLAGDGRRVRATRMLASDKLSLGDWNPVQLRLENTTARSQQLLVRDVPPATFAIDTTVPLFTARLAPRSTTALTYHVKPPRRGDAAFGEVYLRITGPLGLVERTLKQPGPA